MKNTCVEVDEHVHILAIDVGCYPLALYCAVPGRERERARARKREREREREKERERP